jgi:hypothetical protein
MSNDEAKLGLKPVESDSNGTDKSPPPSTNNGEKSEAGNSPSILIEWDGDKDPLDPRTFSAARKWFYVAVVSTGSLLVSVTYPI